MSVAVFGRADMGAFKLRGRPLADAGFKVFELPRNCPPTSLHPHYETIIFTKYWLESAEWLRSRCDRLIWDAVDAWSRHRAKWYPRPAGEYFKHAHKVVGFDEIITTSPSYAQIVTEVLPQVIIHMIPHSPDERSSVDFDPGGDIMYCGSRWYIDGCEEQLAKACKRIGRRLVFPHGKDAWKAKRPVALALNPRVGSHRCELNTHCKPPIKVANSIHCGLPSLSTDDPSVATLFPKAFRTEWRTFLDPNLLGHVMIKAIDRGPTEGEVLRRDQYLQAVKGIVG